MPSSPRFRPPPSEPTGLIVQRRLLHYFDAVCPSRHDIRIRVEASDSDPDDEKHPEGETKNVHLRILLPGLPAQQAQFKVRHARGNVCDIVGGLKGQPPQHFSVCLSPSPGDAALEEVGRFVLEQIERRIGTRVLRRLTASGPSAARMLAALLNPEEEAS
jgi:hypothetical protein